ncbi:MAG: hypothetical protein MUC31_08475 [Bacteroidales bacterium]|jgi:hypothetical protein|nr:hypothetical protein [Bacteroidales bacterium]
MNIVFFKRPKPRQFNYKPIYFDPEKDEAESRRKALNSDDPKERMRYEMKRRWKTDKKSPVNNNNIIRIIIYFVFAAFAIYLIFFTEFINNLVSIFLR